MSSHHLPTELSSSPPGPYHQEPYVSKPEERFKAPPILPPHLLQVILNKDTGISVSAQASAGPPSMLLLQSTSCETAREKAPCCPPVLTARVHIAGCSRVWVWPPRPTSLSEFIFLVFHSASAQAPFLLSFVTK